MKKLLRAKALRLRSLGYSMGEISDRLHISQSTAYLWVKNVQLSTVAQKRLLDRGAEGRAKGVLTNRKKRQALLKKITEKVRKELGSVVVSKTTARLLCAMLYWGEGSKKTNCLGFTNSDPLMMRVFLTLLRQSFMLNPAKFSVCLHLHEYHNEADLKKFWSEVMEIPEKLFIKSFLKSNTGKSKKEGYLGCVSVHYYDYTVALELTAVWKLFGKKLLGESVNW